MGLKVKWFLAIESLLYAAFLVIDITDAASSFSSNVLKYAGIVLCFLFTLMYRAENERKKLWVLRAALLFTVTADSFLLFTGQFGWGVTSFIIVQSCYWYRLSGYRWNPQWWYLCGAAAILVVLAGAGFTLDYTAVAAGMYFALLLRNVLVSGQKKDIRLFFAGMVLFLLCDVNVGLYNLSGYVELPGAVSWWSEQVAGVVIWMFYLPSQVLLAISGADVIKTGSDVINAL